MKEEQIINKWLLGELTAEEEEQFKKLPEYPELIKIWEGLGKATPPRIDVENELNKFHAARKKEAKTVPMFGYKQLVGIAASILIVFFIGYQFLDINSSDADVVFTASQTQLFLPDSSSVFLNKGSRLSYNGDDWGNNRSVKLDGEGFFKVKPGSAFDVTTTQGTVSVLGTEFNVKQRETMMEVVCYEGKVGVAASSQNVVLTKGKGFRIIDDIPDNFEVSTGLQPDWMSGKTTFFKMPFQLVLQELENQYEVTVEMKGISGKETFSGSFPNNNLKIALDAITAPSGYTYQIIDDKVLILSESK